MATFNFTPSSRITSDLRLTVSCVLNKQDNPLHEQISESSCSNRHGVASRLASSDAIIPSNKDLPLYPNEGWQTHWPLDVPNDSCRLPERSWRPLPDQFFHLFNVSVISPTASPTTVPFPSVEVCTMNLKLINYVVNSSSCNTFIFPTGSLCQNNTFYP
jgi:hypothetical protein